MGRLESIPLPDVESVTSVLRSGFNHLGDEQAAELTGLLGGLAATGGATAPVVGWFVVKTLASSKVVEVGQDVDRRLVEYADRLDESDQKQAAAIKLASGISKMLPDGEELREASLEAAAGNPERLAAVLERYQDEEKRSKLEEVVEDLLAGRIDGESEEFVERLQDGFGTDTPEEALGLFREFREVLHEREVHETLEAVLGVEVEVEQLRDELRRTRHELNDGIGSLFQIELGGQGFQRLTPMALDGEPASPKVAWRAGFQLGEVAEGHAMERRREDSDRTVREELVERLRDDGENVVVLGPPGSGKSTVSMQAAVEWYTHQYGTVLYREDGPPSFENEEVLRQAIRQGDGHVLVVVEDAIRESANSVLDLAEEYRTRTDVSFLLDARRREWADEGDETLEPRTSQYAKNEFEPYPVPPLYPEEGERLVEHFRDVTGSTASPDPERLLERVRTDKVRADWSGDAAPGGIYLVLQRLSNYADPLAEYGEDARTPTPLLEDVRRVYDDLAAEGTTALDVALAANLLNAAGFGLYRELLYALAPDEAFDGDAEFEAADTALAELMGRVVFDRDTSTDPAEAPRFRGTHELYSVAFLEYALDAEEPRKARRRFGRCVTRMLALADDPERRATIDDALEGGVGYLDEVESDPEEWADDWLDRLLEFGREYPGLAPLFGTSENDRVSLPAACSLEQRLKFINQRGTMYLDAGYLEEATDEFEVLPEVAFEVLAKSVSQKRWCARSYEHRGLVARQQGDLQMAQRHHRRSLEINRELDDRGYAAASLNNLGLVARECGNLDEAEEYHRLCLEIQQDLGDHHDAAKTLNNLGTVAQKRGDFSRAEDYHRRSLELKRTIGDRHGEARSLHNLGLVTRNRGDLEEAERYHQRSLAILRDIGDHHGVAKVLDGLGQVSRKLDDLDEAKQYHLRSLEINRTVGDRYGEALSLNNLGKIMKLAGNLDRARDYYTQSVEAFVEIDATMNALTALRNLVITCREQEDTVAAREACEWGAELASESGFHDRQLEFERTLLQL